MTVDLVVKNCKLVISSEILEGGLGIDNGKIAVVGRESALPRSDRVIDAKGGFVLPGLVDTHVHFRDPGSTSFKEDWSTGSVAAAAGGVTTVFEMPSSTDESASVRNVAVFREKLEAARKKSVVDFGLYGLVAEDNISELLRLAKAGVVGYKLFLGGSGHDFLDDGGILEALKVIVGTDLRCAMHCENQDILAHFEQKYKSERRRDAAVWSEARPSVAEAEAVARAVIFARETGAKIHIVHLSSREAVEIVREAKAKGIRVSAETCPHYLLLTSDDVKRIGTITRINPPIRQKHDGDNLWRGVIDGTIDNIATDHSPHAPNEKIKDNIWEALSGFIGVETQLPLMLSQVNQGRLSLPHYVQLSCTNPAKLFGVYPEKGCIQIGSDGDLVIIDMKREWEIRSESLHSKTKVTPFDGCKVKGIPVYTIVRGNVVMDHSRIISSPAGRLISPHRS